MSPTPVSVVLVHGAFADGSGWSRVITPLEDAGYRVTAVQNPLTSLADDIAHTRRVLDAQTGPVVLVGHSYGGAVISGAAAGRKDVKALVYVAAFAPDANETLQSLLAKPPSSSIGPALRPDAGGFVSIDREQFRAVFAQDVDAVEARVMAATQKPISGGAFVQTNDAAAWRTLPSWYLVASEDRAIAPDLQRFFAQRMNARTSEVRASHVPFVSQPREVVRVVQEAARATAQ